MRKIPIANFISVLFIIVFGSFVNQPIDNYPYDKKPFFGNKARYWADSLLKQMTLEEKIGQLIMIDAHPAKDKKHWEQVKDLVSKYYIGGVIYFKAGPKQLALMNNMLQEHAHYPLLMSIDAEWGLSMRMDSVLTFPIQMALGAVEDNDLIYKMGKAIARQMKRLGLHINFAPVLDVNNNPLNPVINLRSFSDDKELVVKKAYYYMKGLQDEHILAVGKHFPGHGDTQTDSHHDLPYLNFTRKRLDSLELYPFKEIIKKGIGGIMVAHLNVPALEPQDKLPTTFSYNVVTNLLRRDLRFDGVIFTDALNMKGATKYYKPGEVALKAFLAGNDVLLYPEDVPIAIQTIKEAIQDSLICEDDLDARVRRILMLKYWVGLNHCTYVDTTNIYNDLNDPDDELLIRQITEQTLTVLKNEREILPLKRLDTLKIAYISLSKRQNNIFYESLLRYAPIDSFLFSESLNINQIDKLYDTLKYYNLIITDLHQTNRYSYRTFNLSKESLQFYKGLESLNIPIVLNVFASPYSINLIPSNKNTLAIILAYESNKYTQDITSQLIFGAINSTGRLPVKINEKYLYSAGISIDKLPRLKYTIPEELGFSSKKFKKIDDIVKYAIRCEAFPGCQILIAKNGNVIYHKAFGKMFYDSIPVTLNTIYDLASITKVAATTLSIMKLYEEKKIDLDKKLGDYLPLVKGSDKEFISIDDILTHQARLTAWIPFYKRMIGDSTKWYQYFSKKYSEKYCVKIADSLFAVCSIKDTILQQIIHSKLLPSKKYVYSDLGFILLKEIIELQAGKTLDNYCLNTFYKPLGCITTGYNPLKHFSKNRIAPTENDLEFRKQLIWGYVHDPAAALVGGVEGHAGVFSNANDLAKIAQMLLWKGKYGGTTYFKPTTVKLFTSCYNCPKNRRGLGFDKPEPDTTKNSPVTRMASLQTFGHQGFTGTCMWIDPEQELIYIFLSNRVYPTSENKKINTLSLRDKIFEEVYKIINCQ